MLVPRGKQCTVNPPHCCLQKYVSMWVCVEKCVWKEGAHIETAKILQRNLFGIVMFRQLCCDKIHSFHSATSFLLVTIVSLMPSWRRCLILTEWVKRCRCPEPQNHMLRVKGPRPNKAQLLPLWCGPIRGKILKRVRRIHRGPQHTNPPKNCPTMATEEWIYKKKEKKWGNWGSLVALWATSLSFSLRLRQSHISTQNIFVIVRWLILHHMFSSASLH